MALPPNPDPNASYWGVDPGPAPADDAAINQYWGADAAVPTDPFAAGAAAAGIAPAPTPAEAAAPSPADPFAAGAAKMGIAPPQERVYNDFIQPGSSGASIAGAPTVSLAEPPKLAGGLAPSPPPAGPAPKKDVNLAGIGPTAADDAALAKLNAKLEAPKPKPSGAGAPANPDPYGILAAQKAQLGAFDTRMHAMDRAAAADETRAVKLADNMANLGRMQEEDAAIARAEQDYASQHFDEQMAELGRQLDDVKTRKVDPLKDFKEQPALGILAVVGGAVGGFYQGISGGKSNQFIDDLNRHIDRGIAEQERQIQDQKFAIGQGMNMLQQQRAAQKDDQLAKMQLRNLSYEAAKNEINAEADRDGTPAARARADDAIAQVGQQQAMLQEQIGLKKQQQAIAAANQAYARTKQVQDTYKEVYKELLTQTGDPATAEAEARRAVGVIYYPGSVADRPAGTGGAPLMTREQRGKIAAEHAEAQLASDEFNSQIDAMKKLPALKDLGLETGAASHLGQRLAPDATKTAKDIDFLNTMMLQAVGKVAKDADGKPSQAMLKVIEDRYQIEPSDTEAMAMQKLEGVRNTVNALARQQGATGAPKPFAQQMIANQLGAKPVR
jgi:hypothetical protein